MIKPAIKFEESNYKTLQGRSKQVQTKYVLLRDFGFSFQVQLKVKGNN